MPHLTKQERKVYNYVLAHRGCTTIDMQRDLHIECPSARLTGLRKKGVPIISIGQKKYEGSRAFEMYALDGIGPKPRYHYIERDGVMVEVLINAEPVQPNLMG